jgi:hypothetical protein
MRSVAVPCLALLLASLSSLTAQAQEVPPIKPGLWQVHSERMVDGKKMPAMDLRMGDLPPEARKQMEAMMKQRGVDMSAGGGDIKMCLSKESLDQNQWLSEKTGPHACKTDFKSRSGNRWTWHSSCTEPKSESDGEATFNGPESYAVKVATTMTMKGETRTTNMSTSSKWLSADCGDVKPFSAKNMGAPGPKSMRPMK